MEDHQRKAERVRSQQVHDGRGNGAPHDNRRISIKEKVAAGILLGVLAYLVTSCFYEINQPKLNIDHHFNRPYQTGD